MNSKGHIFGLGFSFYLVLGCSPLSGSAAIVQTAEQTVQGIVAYYPLNGDAADASGNELNGTLKGATPTRDRFDRANQALYFDGGAAYIECGNPAAFNFEGSFTLAAWIKAESDSLGQYVVGKYKSGENSAASNSYGLGTDLGGGPYGFISGSSPGYQEVGWAPKVADGQWHAVALVYDAGKTLRLYRDGIEVSSLSVGVYPPFTNSHPLRIGAIASGQYFHGAIDEVRIFNRAVSAADIATLYFFDTEQYAPLNLRAADLLYDSRQKLIYATIRSNAPVYPNHLVAINPESFVVNDLGDIGEGAGKLASDDHGTLYIGLDGTMEVQSFNTVSRALGGKFPVGPGLSIRDIAVSPTDTNLVAVSKSLPRSGQRTALYDSGVQRTNTFDLAFAQIEFSDDGKFLYGFRPDVSSFYRAPVEPGGLGKVKTLSKTVAGTDFAIASQRAYLDSGNSISLIDATLSQPFPGIGSPSSMALREDLDRIAFLFRANGGWDIQQLALKAEERLTGGPLNGVPDSATGLIQLDASRLVFRSDNAIYLLNLKDLSVPRDMALHGQIALPFKTDLPSAQDPFSYTFIASNAGTNPAYNVTIRHQLPPNFTVNSASAGSYALPVSNGQVLLSVPKVMPGQSITMTLNVTAEREGIFDLIADVAADGSDATPANNKVSMVATVQPAAQVFIHHARVFESGPTFPFVNYIPLTLSHRVQGSVKVTCQISPGAATKPADYLNDTFTVTFKPGEVKASGQLSIAKDSVPEPDEDLTIAITSVTGAVIGNGQATVIVLDDDASYILAHPTSAYEGEKLQFLIQLSGPQSQPVSVSYGTLGQTATLQDFDFTAGTLTFAPGETSRIVEVPLVLDEETESDEQLSLVLYDAIGANILRSEAAGVIHNRTPEQAAFRISSLAVDSDGLRVSFHSQKDRAYQIQLSTPSQPSVWQNVGPIITATSEESTILVPNQETPANALFRVSRVQ